MKRFALNFICKNESHVITRMLDSVKPITDLIVAIDTGSTDNTIPLIYSFGERHSIPTYVFERPFDNFGNSRNFALERLISTIQLLKWQLDESWGFRMDCDEKLIFSENFSKDSINEDLCYSPLLYKNYKDAEGHIFNKDTKRQLFFRLSKNFSWDGPVHESLECDCSYLSTAKLSSVSIVREPLGSSWSENREKKLSRWAMYIEDFMNQGHHTLKWIKYSADIYFDLAAMAALLQDRSQYAKQSLLYYLEMTQLDLSLAKTHVKYEAYHRIALLKYQLDYPQNDVHEAFLQAYKMDKRHGEPIYAIIKDYINRKQWIPCYKYSSFAIAHFHDNKPQNPEMSGILNYIYDWKFLYYHIIVCLKSAQTQEAKLNFSKLRILLSEKELTLSPKDCFQIIKVPFLLTFSAFKPRLTKSPSSRASQPPSSLRL